MRVSISLTNQSWTPGSEDLAGALGDVARAADAAGVDTVWLPDHLIQADPTASPEDRDMLESCTTLGFLAGVTERVRIGAMVSAVTFRPPAMLIKAVTSLDVLSGGRAWFGIGAGHHGGEAEAMGLDLPSVRERFERLEDTLELALQMWRGDDAAFTGRHYSLARPEGRPLPVTRPHPPILIGGHGEKRTLPLVARYADACNVFDIPDGGRTVRHKLAVLERLCEEAGRPYTEIEKTLSTRLGEGETTDDFLRRLEEMTTWGIDHAIVGLSKPWRPEALDTIADTISKMPA